MVDPVSDEDRERTLLWTKITLVVLVAGSAGLVTSQGDASLGVLLGAVTVGAVVGAALAWYLVPSADDISPARDRRYRK